MLMFAVPAAVIVMALAGPAVRPPSLEEQKAFSEGLRLFDAGDARGAERAWRAGYAAGRDPAFLVRIGEAQEKAGVPTEALKSYEQYLRESPDAADRADIEARVRRLAPPAAARPAIEIETPGEMAAPGGVPSPSPEGAGGTASAPRGAETGGGVSPGAGGTQVRDQDENEDLRPLIEDEAPRSAANTAAWVGAGMTAALLGVAGFYGAKAAEKAGDANRLLLYSDDVTGVPQEYGPRAREYEDLVSEGQRDDRVATGLLIAAGVTAVASAILFVVDGRRADDTPKPRAANGVLRRSRLSASVNGRPRLTVGSTREAPAPALGPAGGRPSAGMGAQGSRAGALGLSFELAWKF